MKMQFAAAWSALVVLIPCLSADGWTSITSTDPRTDCCTDRVGSTQLVLIGTLEKCCEQRSIEANRYDRARSVADGPPPALAQIFDRVASLGLLDPSVDLLIGDWPILTCLTLHLNIVYEISGLSTSFRVPSSCSQWIHFPIGRCPANGRNHQPFVCGQLSLE